MSQMRKERAATGGDLAKKSGVELRTDLSSCPSSRTPGQGHLDGTWRGGNEGGGEEGKGREGGNVEFENDMTRHSISKNRSHCASISRPGASNIRSLPRESDNISTSFANLLLIRPRPIPFFVETRIACWILGGKDLMLPKHSIVPHNSALSLSLLYER